MFVCVVGLSFERASYSSTALAACCSLRTSGPGCPWRRPRTSCHLFLLLLLLRTSQPCFFAPRLWQWLPWRPFWPCKARPTSRPSAGEVRSWTQRPGIEVHLGQDDGQVEQELLEDHGPEITHNGKLKIRVRTYSRGLKRFTSTVRLTQF